MACPRMTCAPPPKPRLSEIVKTLSGSKGSYTLTHDDGTTSALTISILSPQTVIADHTGVDPGHEGQGVGAALVAALIADARASGFRIIPLCPYVNAQRRKHPTWADLFNV